MRKQWTEWEIQYLEKKYVNQSVERTAKKLHRTEASVKHKARILGLNHYADCIGAKSVARCFGVDIAVVLRWIYKLDLPTMTLKAGNQTRYDIETEEFWKWAESHKEEINWSRYEVGSLLPEPEWVKEAKVNFKNHKSRKRISDYEKIQIKNMLRRGYCYKEIADRIGRSYYSVKHIGRTLYCE